MDGKNKVIPFDRNRVKQGQKNLQVSHLETRSAETSPVVDMTARRQEIIREDRRRLKRTILTEFIGASVIVPGRGLMKVMIFDISENGISFDWSVDAGSFKNGEEVAMRVYINHQTFFPFTVKIQNARVLKDEEVVRHGGVFLKESVNEEALFHFVKFVESVSHSLESDSGDRVAR